MMRLPACLLLLFFASAGVAQLPANDSGTFYKAYHNTVSAYLDSMRSGSMLFNGKAFDRYWQGVRGHPFFLSDQFAEGTVTYEGIIYPSVPLLYDLARDVLVTKDYTGKAQVMLLTERVSAFTIGNRQFLRMPADSAAGAGVPAGFYELLFDQAGWKALVRRKNETVRVMKAEDTYLLAGQGDNRFMEFDYYYMVRRGTFHAIRGEGDLLTMFSDHRADMRKFLNRKEIQYKKDPSGVIVKSLQYYLSLVP